MSIFLCLVVSVLLTGIPFNPRSCAMTSFLRYSLSMISTIIFSLLAFSASAQDYKVGSSAAYALSVELRSGDTDRIVQAFDQFPDYNDVYDDASLLVNIDPFVVDGLISALDSQLDLFLDENTGLNEEYFYEGVIFPLVTYLSIVKDRKIIPVLLRASERNTLASLTLAKFGPDMVPVILDYMYSPECTLYQFKGSFYTLNYIVRLWRPLDAETHATLKQLAIDSMRGNVPEHLMNHPSSYQVKYHASHLASQLGDADLKQIVIDIADEIPGFVELDLKQWYNPDMEAIDSDQIDLND